MENETSEELLSILLPDLQKIDAQALLSSSGRDESDARHYIKLSLLSKD